jgi:hypothetical protein
MILALPQVKINTPRETLRLINAYFRGRRKYPLTFQRLSLSHQTLA